MSKIESQILNHGTKFVITDASEDSTYGPGTVGYVSHIKGFDQDFVNVAYFVAVIIRRGKTGKDRLETAELSTPIFEIDEEDFKKKMPDEKRRFYVHIETAAEPINVVSMDTYDFMGWAVATALFVHKLCSKSKHFQPWPKPKNHLLNKVLNLTGMWSESPDHAVYEIQDNSTREEFARHIRRMESTLVKASLGYLAKLASLEETAAGFVMKNASKKKVSKTFHEVAKIRAMRKVHLQKMSKSLTPSKKSK